jgi:hypothetical protein
VRWTGRPQTTDRRCRQHAANELGRHAGHWARQGRSGPCRPGQRLGRACRRGRARAPASQVDASAGLVGSADEISEEEEEEEEQQQSEDEDGPLFGCSKCRFCKAGCTACRP